MRNYPSEISALEIQSLLALIPLLLGAWAIFRKTGIFLFYFFLLTVLWPEGLSVPLLGKNIAFARIFPLTVIAGLSLHMLWLLKSRFSDKNQMAVVLGYSLFFAGTFLMNGLFNQIRFGYFPIIYLKSAIFSLWVAYPFFLEALDPRKPLRSSDLVQHAAWITALVFLFVTPQSIAYYFEFFDSLWRVRPGAFYTHHLSQLIVFTFNGLDTLLFTLDETGSMLFSIFSAAPLYYILKWIYQGRKIGWILLIFLVFVLAINQYLKMIACLYVLIFLYPAVYFLTSRIRLGHITRPKFKKTVAVLGIAFLLMPFLLQNPRGKDRIQGGLKSVVELARTFSEYFDLDQYLEEDGTFFELGEKLELNAGWVREGENQGGNRMSRIQITWNGFIESPMGRGLTPPPPGQGTENKSPMLSGVSYLIDNLYVFGIFGGLLSYLFLLVGPWFFTKPEFYRVFSFKESYFLIGFWTVLFFMSVVGLIPRTASSKSLVHFFNLWLISRFYMETRRALPGLKAK